MKWTRFILLMGFCISCWEQTIILPYGNSKYSMESYYSGNGVIWLRIQWNTFLHFCLYRKVSAWFSIEILYYCIFPHWIQGTNNSGRDIGIIDDIQILVDIQLNWVEWRSDVYAFQLRSTQFIWVNNSVLVVIWISIRIQRDTICTQWTNKILRISSNEITYSLMWVFCVFSLLEIFVKLVKEIVVRLFVDFRLVI